LIYIALMPETSKMLIGFHKVASQHPTSFGNLEHLACLWRVVSTQHCDRARGGDRSALVYSLRLRDRFRVFKEAGPGGPGPGARAEKCHR